MLERPQNRLAPGIPLDLRPVPFKHFPQNTNLLFWAFILHRNVLSVPFTRYSGPLSPLPQNLLQYFRAFFRNLL